MVQFVFLLTSDQEVMLTTVLTNELKSHIVKEKKIPLDQIELRMTHVKDVKVDYDYLTELVEQLLNQVHEGKNEKAKETQEKITNLPMGWMAATMPRRLSMQRWPSSKGTSRWQVPASSILRD